MRFRETRTDLVQELLVRWKSGDLRSYSEVRRQSNPIRRHHTIKPNEDKQFTVSIFNTGQARRGIYR